MRTWLRRVLLLVGLGVCVATSAPRLARQYPAWEFTGPTQRGVACAGLEAWVSKSGKTGMGVTVQASAPAQRCRVRVHSARFQVGDAWVHAEPKEGWTFELEPGQEKHLYVPFLFDNELAWNMGRRTGRWAVGLEVGGAVQADWAIEATHVLQGFHQWRVTR